MRFFLYFRIGSEDQEHVEAQFLKKEGIKLTFMPVIIEAIVKAIKDFPLINVSVVGDTIVKKKEINIIKIDI